VVAVLVVVVPVALVLVAVIEVLVLLVLVEEVPPAPPVELSGGFSRHPPRKPTANIPFTAWIRGRRGSLVVNRSMESPRVAE
jgi:hypothetical protein